MYYGSVGYSESQYEPIEITLDNWQDYFEFKEYHKFEENGFGEFESASTSYYLITKDEINVDVENSDVTRIIGTLSLVVYKNPLYLMRTGKVRIINV